MRPLVLVCGASASGKKSVARGLLQLLGHDEAAATKLMNEAREAPRAADGGAGANASSSLPEGTIFLPFDLKTKYYTAALEMAVLPSSHFDAAEVSLEGVEALIMVMDSSKGAPALTVASKWAGAAADSGIGCLLCAWNKADCDGPATPKEKESHGEAMLGWCLDNGFEHVECVASMPLEGSVGREKSSVARVLEALQSTMWSNIVRATAAPPSASTAVSSSSSAASSSLEKAAEKEGAYDVLNPHDEAAKALLEAEEKEAEGLMKTTTKAGDGDDDDGAFAGESDDAAKALMAAMAASPQEGGSKKTTGAASAAAAKGKGKPGPSAAALEDIDKDFGRIFEEVKAVRDAAKSGKMTDEQRREAAAQATMRLMAMFGGMGMGMGDEDEDEEEEAAQAAPAAATSKQQSSSKTKGNAGAGSKK